MKRIDLKSLNKVLINSIKAITENPMKLKNVDAHEAIKKAVQDLDEAYEKEAGAKLGTGLNVDEIPEHLLIKDK